VKFQIEVPASVTPVSALTVLYMTQERERRALKLQHQQETVTLCLLR